MQMSFMTSFVCSRVLKGIGIQTTVRKIVIFKPITLQFAIWIDKR